MTIRYFFQCCHDLVATNWLCLVGQVGDLNLVLKVDFVNEEPTPFTHPLFAVANAVTGFVPTCDKDVWKARERLGLKPDFAVMLFVAAETNVGLDRHMMEVREELVERLRPKPLYAPHFNALPRPTRKLYGPIIY